MNIESKDEFHLVGYYVVAPMEELSTRVPEANERMLAQLDEVDARTGQDLLSVTLGVEDEVYTQFVGVQVEPDAAAPADMESLDLRAARWVRFTHDGPAEGIGSSIFTMRQWADQNDQPTEHVFVAFHPLDDDGPIDLLVRLDEASV